MDDITGVEQDDTSVPGVTLQVWSWLLVTASATVDEGAAVAATVEAATLEEDTVVTPIVDEAAAGEEEDTVEAATDAAGEFCFVANFGTTEGCVTCILVLP